MSPLPWMLFALVASLGVSQAYKLLVVFPFPGKSHGILGDGYVRLLLEAGHEVTYITPFASKNSHPNLQIVDVSANMEIFPDNVMSIKNIMDGTQDPTQLSHFFKIILALGKGTFTNPNVQKILNDPSQKFDLIIMEWMYTEMGAGLSAVLDCPFVWSSSMEPHWMVTELIDEVLNPAYNSDSMSLYSPPFDFLQRIDELWKQSYTYVLLSISFKPYESKNYEDVFGPLVAKRGRSLPPLDEIRYNASLMLGNSHVSLGQATRLPQNYKPIAGYHIDSNIKPLPQDLQKLMDDSHNGVIYFSMGTNLKSKDLSADIKKGLLNVFRQLKYTVIWKFEEVLPDMPENVRILNWAPQPSILAHKNCKLFITHGGLLSTTEALHYGVPIIGIPVFADQFVNVERAVKKGFAVKVKLSHSMVEDLKMGINDILGNTKYAEKAKELSMVYHDRPVSPGAELVHWVEHVVRTRGAPHLRSPALRVPWYQKMYLDLAAIILALLLVLRTIFRRLFCRNKKVVNKKKKN